MNEPRVPPDIPDDQFVHCLRPSREFPTDAEIMNLGREVMMGLSALGVIPGDSFVVRACSRPAGWEQ